ncbi:transposase family protein [Gimesia chilikensis]|nr:transposase family protein [Gimesia chilikensis]
MFAPTPREVGFIESLSSMSFLAAIEKTAFWCCPLYIIESSLYTQLSLAMTRWVADNFSRESLAIQTGQRLTGDDVVQTLKQVTQQRGAHPETIRVDNGPEFISKSLDW